MSYISKGDGIYQDTRTRNLYHRPRINGQRTFRKLRSTTLTAARREVALLKTRQMESELGAAPDPYAPLTTVGQIAEEWQRRGCPDRKGRSRAGESLGAEIARLGRLLPFWNSRPAAKITAEDCFDYHTFRTRSNKKRFRLGRSVDAELTTLSNLLNWAAVNPSKTGLRSNPIRDTKPRFDDRTLTRHCTAVMPPTDEAVHQAASYLLSFKRSEALGWQLLLEALTGARTSEILACRVDAAKPRQPGYHDRTALHIDRLKKGIEPWALLEAIPGHAPLAELLTAFFAWHKKRYARSKSPWFIPGHNPAEPMNRRSLTQSLRRACRILGLPPITSHGLRAYYVRSLRSLGVDDSEIAKRLGQRSGVTLVEQTYGISEPGWFGSRTLDFLPAPPEKPAWAPWLPAGATNIVHLAAYHPHTRPGKTRSNPGKSSTRKNPSKPAQIRHISDSGK
jgi:integrase